MSKRVLALDVYGILIDTHGVAAELSRGFVVLAKSA